MLFDDTGRILLLSRTWSRAAGCSAGDMRTITDWHAYASTGEGSVVAFLRRAINRESTNQRGDFRFLTKDGRRRDWSLVASALGPLADGRHLYICVANDITERRRAEAQQSASERHFRQLLEALPTAVYTTDPVGRVTFYNQTAAELWGHSPALGEQWSGSWRLYWPDGRPMPHEESPMAIALKEDRSIRGIEVIAERPDATRVSFVPYPTPLHDAAGRLIGAVNMLVDRTGRRRAERRLGLLAREVDHRTKNMLAVIQGMIRFTHADTVREFTTILEGRIMALARAHSLLSENQWDGADLKSLAEHELTPYSAANEGRVRIAGDSWMLAPATVQSMAMTLHELATNAAKHGALAETNGTIDLRWSHDLLGGLAVIWIETGGASVSQPRRMGFGLTLIERTISDQLDGKVTFDWRPSGLTCRILIPAQDAAATASASAG